MSEEKFTQGKWEIEEKSASYCDLTRFGFQVISPEMRKRVCYSETDDEKNISEMQANAALIAAAPEMYAKLKTVLALCEGRLLRKTRCDILGAEIDDLLKKARGEA